MLFFIELGTKVSGDQEEIVEHLVPVEDHRLYSFDVGGKMHAKSLQLCPTLFDPMDCSPPGASVYGILQARILEWVAMPSSRGPSLVKPRSHGSCIGLWVIYH